MFEIVRLCFACEMRVQRLECFRPVFLIDFTDLDWFDDVTDRLTDWLTDCICVCMYRKMYVSTVSQRIRLFI